MRAPALFCRSKASRAAKLIAALSLLGASVVLAGEHRIVLRDQIEQEWRNELLTYPFSAPHRACHPGSVTLAGPGGPVPVQLSKIEYWPGTPWVKSAELSFIANLSPLATDHYTVRYDAQPAAPSEFATDLTITPGTGKVEITTRGFGVRLLQGEKRYPEPAPAADVPGPIVGMRIVDDRDDLLIITTSGTIIRQEVAKIRQIGRSTQGVRLIRLDKKDQVASIARVVGRDEEGDEGD